MTPTASGSPQVKVSCNSSLPKADRLTQDLGLTFQVLRGHDTDEDNDSTIQDDSLMAVGNTSQSVSIAGRQDERAIVPFPLPSYVK